MGSELKCRKCGYLMSRLVVTCEQCKEVQPCKRPTAPAVLDREDLLSIMDKHLCTTPINEMDLDTFEVNSSQIADCADALDAALATQGTSDADSELFDIVLEKDPAMAVLRREATQDTGCEGADLLWRLQTVEKCLEAPTALCGEALRYVRECIAALLQNTPAPPEPQGECERCDDGFIEGVADCPRIRCPECKGTERTPNNGDG